MESRPLLKKRQWLTIGLKLILGITLASNLCIGILLYSNWLANKGVEQQVNSLLQIQAEMSRNLRETIYNLQENYQQIPKIFQEDKGNRFLEWIRTGFEVESEETLTGRENYKSLYNRTARRDLAKGNAVVQDSDGELYVSQGLLDADGDFTESVLRMKLVSGQPTADQERIRTYLASARDSGLDAGTFEKKLNQLNSYLADEAIHAEKTRNEILYKVEEMTRKEEELKAFQSEKQKQNVLMGIITIVINIAVLLALTGTIIERPLRKLTALISKIQSGEAPEIPYQNRQDKIGILAHSIKGFRDSMLQLKEEDRRKSIEKKMINDFINNISGLIHHLRQESREMADNALNLTELAQTTEQQSNNVIITARNTADNAGSISTSTTELQAEVEAIVEQITRQSELVSILSRETLESKNRIQHLQEATEQIHGIIKIIKEITQKSKLLAINATIEAARYGARGAGFLVVANEMKELSNQTEQGADDITSKTEAIYNAGNVFVKTMLGIENHVQNLANITSTIDSAARNQSLATGSIAEKTMSTSSDSQDVSARIVKVNDAAVTTREMALKVSDYSEDIAVALGNILSQTKEKLMFLVDSGRTDLPKN